MDFSAANDGDFFETLKRQQQNRHNLDDLFGIGESAGHHQPNENPTLKYQPPKASAVKPAASPWTTEIVRIVTAYKNNEHLGKVGVALLKSAAALKIIAYKTKTNVLATLSLRTDDLAAKDEGKIYQQNAYTQFYDDSKAFWSFRFESTKDEEEFLKALGDNGVEVQKNCTSKETEQKVEEIVKEEEEEEKEKIAIKTAQNIPKPSLVTRMAKIGGQQLPLAVTTKQQQQHLTTTTDYSDSSDTEIIKPVVIPRQRSTQQLVPMNPVYAVTQPQAPAMEAPYMQMLLTENRTQNSEMRMNISKLDAKMDSLLDRFEAVRSRGAATQSSQQHEDELLALEEKILELKKENRKLKQSGDGRTEANHQHKWEIFMADLQDDLEALQLKPRKDSESLIRDLVRQSLTMQNDLSKAEREKYRLQSQLNEERLKAEQHEDLIKQQEDSLKTLSDKAKETALLELQEQQRKLIESMERKHKEHTSNLGSALKYAMMDLYTNLITQLTEMDPAMGSEKTISHMGRAIKQEIHKTYEELNKRLDTGAGQTNKN